jgi:transposase
VAQIAPGPVGVFHLEQYPEERPSRRTSRIYKVEERTSMVHEQSVKELAWVGIDVSKDTMDACLLKPSMKTCRKAVTNNALGFAKLTRWLEHQAPTFTLHVCLEATGAYSVGVAQHLVESGYLVSVVNGFVTRHHGIAMGVVNKTDPIDAGVIADYCRAQRPKPWHLGSPEVRELVGMLRRHTSLQAHLQQENNRLGEPGLVKDVSRSLKQSIRFTEKQIAKLYAQISKHIDNHPQLKADTDLLTSIPGIGDLTAMRILAELPDVHQFENASQAAAYAGLNPCEYRSGKTVHKRTRISKRGNQHLRRTLYMPALSACRSNPLCADLYQRLIKRGMCRKAAMVAVMRKLIMLAYGVLKSRQTFSADYCPAAT